MITVVGSIFTIAVYSIAQEVGHNAINLNLQDMKCRRIDIRRIDARLRITRKKIGLENASLEVVKKPSGMENARRLCGRQTDAIIR